MTKAYSYIRFSTPEQSKGRSLPRQLELCEAYCKKNNLDLVKAADYSFLDKGKSASKGQHLEADGQLRRFLNLVEDGTIEKGSYLIIESLDRLSREHVKDALPRFMDLLKSGINIVTLSDEKVYREDYSETDLIMSIIFMTRAHEESAIKAQRLGDVFRKKREQARETLKPLGNVAPFFIDFIDEKYQLNEERTAVVRRIFELALSYGKGAIAKKLNEEGIPSFKGKTWQQSSVDKILKNNRAVLGEYQPHTKAGRKKREPVGEPIKGYFPPAIDEITFYAAQAAIEQRRVTGSTKQSKTFNLFSGIAHCGECGARMHLVNKGAPPKGNKYLRCGEAKKGLCEGSNVRLDQAEEVLREILSKLDSLALIQDNSGKLNKELSAVEGRLSELKSNLSDLKARLKKKYSDTVADLVDESEGEVKGLEKEQEDLKQQLANEKITSKEEFLSKLDTESYEGRARVNSLLKRLGVQIVIAKSEEDRVAYVVLQGGERILGIVQNKEEIKAHPYNSEQMDKHLTQDFGDTVSRDQFIELVIKSHQAGLIDQDMTLRESVEDAVAFMKVK